LKSKNAKKKNTIHSGSSLRQEKNNSKFDSERKIEHQNLLAKYDTDHSKLEKTSLLKSEQEELD